MVDVNVGRKIMKDVLVRLISKEAGLRGLACITTDIVKEGARRHKTAPTSTVALGEALTSAALFGSALLKIKQRVAVKFDGDGILGRMIVESDNYGRVRGYVANGAADLPLISNRYDTAGIIGKGSLIVVKDIGMRDLIDSHVPLVDGGIGAIITHYLNQSEQLPSTLEVGVKLSDDHLVAAAGGVLVQAMPGHDSAIIADFQNRLQELPPIADLLHNGLSAEQLLHDIFHDVDHEILEHRDLAFVCSCSYERSEQAIIALGIPDVDELIEEGQAVVDCHFCNERFVFNTADLRDIRAMM